MTKLKKIIGQGIDFPLVMNYKEDTRQETLDRRQEGLWSNVYSPKSHTRDNSKENFFYFLNGHGDVTYFADQNFTEEQIESYEYSPWGVLLTSASKNNLLYTAREFDFESNIYASQFDYYSPEIGNFRNYFQKIFYVLENIKKLNFIDLPSISSDMSYYKVMQFISFPYKWVDYRICAYWKQGKKDCFICWFYDDETSAYAGYIKNCVEIGGTIL